MKSLFASAVVVLAATPAFAEEKRSADAHEHGHGAFRIAVDGADLLMEIEAPGADIVGFEHEPKSDEDRAAIKNAVALLSDVNRLFVLPEAAGCAVSDIDVDAPHGDEHHDKHDDDHAKDDDHAENDDHKDDDHKDGDHEEEEHAEEHSEFAAEYHLNCSDIAALGTIRTTYFELFPNAVELETEVLAPGGASVQELDAANPIVVIKH